MILGIDASNIRAGGGITHLIGILSTINPNTFGFRKVIIWGGDQLDKIPESSWLVKRKVPALNKTLLHRIYWQKFKLSKLARENCTILFSPAGNYSGSFHPFVSMSQNMLVFDKKERGRYFFSWIYVRLLILTIIQSKSFKKADSLIFISNYAKNYILNFLQIKDKDHLVIHHGISDRFRKSPTIQKDITEYTKERPFKILYVSIIDLYKHQTILVQAVEKLLNENFPVELELVGPAYGPYLKQLNKIVNKIEKKDYIKIRGKVNFEEISNIYKSTDAFVFCSSCENMPNIVIEAMSAGLPIATSNYEPMPEFLKDAAVYFDPVSIKNTYDCLKELIKNKDERQEKADLAYKYSQEYSWEKCSNETFNHLKNVALHHLKK